MFMEQPPARSHRQSVNALYKAVGVESLVHSADPHQLVSLLFDGFFDATALARSAIEQRDIPTKCAALRKALRIVDEGLRAGLNLQGGTQLAEDLRALYAYVSLRLTQANLHNDVKALDEARQLMTPLRDAWQSIRGQI